MPKVTVVTAARNAAEFLPEALDSIRRQTLRDWEHVVVDDGSTDATADLVRRYAEEDPRFRLVSLPESVGPYRAANHALLAADSQYLARLDADDLALPDRLATQVAQLERAPRPSASVGAWRFLRAGMNAEEPLHTVPTHRNGVMRWMLCLRGGPLHSTLMIDAALFRELGGYGPERVAEDYRLWCKLSTRDAMLTLDDCLVRYRKHEKQITARTGTRDESPRLKLRVEHLNAMMPHEAWTEDEARDFRYVGEVAEFSLARAMQLYQRWRSGWRSDASLSADDQAELDAFAATLFATHVAGLARTSRVEAALGVARHPGVALRAATRLVRTGGLRRW